MKKRKSNTEAAKHQTQAAQLKAKNRRIARKMMVDLQVGRDTGFIQPTENKE